MKKATKKLKLSKDTITRVSGAQLDKVRGGKSLEVGCTNDPTVLNTCGCFALHPLPIFNPIVKPIVPVIPLDPRLKLG